MTNSETIQNQRLRPQKTMQWYGNFLEETHSPQLEEKQEKLNHGLPFIKLFLVDIADRVKELRRHKKTRFTQYIVDFLLKLSISDDPVAQLKKLNLVDLTDFQSFLENTSQSLERDYQPDKLSQSYQVLTENIESTAEYLNAIFLSIEKQPDSINSIVTFVSGSASKEETQAIVQPKDYVESIQITDMSVKGQSFFDPKVFSGFNVDFGFNLSELFSNGENVINKSAFISPTKSLPAEIEVQSVEATTEELLEEEYKTPTYNNLQRLLKDITNTAIKETRSPLVISLFEKLSNSPNTIDELNSFYSIPEFPGFLEFVHVLNQQESFSMSEEEEQGLIQHVLNILDNALNESDIVQKIEDYIHSGELDSFGNIDSSEFESSLPDIAETKLEDDNILELSDEALKAFASELEDSTEIIKSNPKSKLQPSDSDDLSFSNYAKGILLKVNELLPSTESGRMAAIAISHLIHRSEIIDALVVTGLPGLSDFGEFIQTSLNNKTKLNDITNFSNDIIQEIRQKLVAHFDAGGTLEPNIESLDANLESENELLIQESDPKKLGDFESFIYTILDQVKIQLQESPALVTYLDDLCTQQNILNKLVKSDIDCLKNFALFAQDSINNNVSVNELSQKSEQIISELVTELKNSDFLLKTPGSDDVTEAVESLETHLDEEPQPLALPSLSEFTLDDDDLNFDSETGEENSEGIEASIASTYAQSILDELLVFAHNRPGAKKFLQNLINSPDVISELESTTLSGFKEFSGFLIYAISNSISQSELDQNKDEIINVLKQDITSNPDFEVIEVPTVVESKKEIKLLPAAEIDENLSLDALFEEHQVETDPSNTADSELNILVESPESTAEKSKTEITEELATELDLSSELFEQPDGASKEEQPETESLDSEELLTTSYDALPDLEIPDDFIIAEPQDEQSEIENTSTDHNFLNLLHDNESEDLLDDSDTLWEESLEETTETVSDAPGNEPVETSSENIREDLFKEDMSLLSEQSIFDTNAPKINPEDSISEETSEELVSGDKSEKADLSEINQLLENTEELEIPEPTDEPEPDAENHEEKAFELEDVNLELEASEELDITTPTEESETKFIDLEQSPSEPLENYILESEPASPESVSEQEGEDLLSNDELVNFDTDLILDDTQPLNEETVQDNSSTFNFDDSLENFGELDDSDLALSDTIFNPDEPEAAKPEETELPESLAEKTEETLQNPAEDFLNLNNDSDLDSLSLPGETDALTGPDLETSLETSVEPPDNTTELTENLAEINPEKPDPFQEFQELSNFGDMVLNDDNLILDDSAELTETSSNELDLDDTQEKEAFQPDEIQKVFLEEAQEYIEKLNADLLELDKVADTLQPELVNTVLRSSHTIKGSAAMVQLNNISDLAHKMEDSLQIVRDKNLPIPRVLIDVLFQSADAISSMLNHFRQTGTDKSEDFTKLSDTLNFYSTQLEENDRIVDFDLPSKEEPEVEDFQPNEIQQVFLEEAQEYIEKLNVDLLELEKHVDTAQPELVNKVLRGAHTIKGSAAMVQLNGLSDLAHKMEDSLQIIRDQNLKIPKLLIDTLFQSVDAIAEMLGNFKHTGKDTYNEKQPLAEALEYYQKQLDEKGEISEVFVPQTVEEKTLSTQKTVQKPQQPSVAEQTVRIDIAALNNLVNLSAELVIARNRLNNELGAVEKLAAKFLKERQSLSQISKKINESIKKTYKSNKDENEQLNTRIKDASIIESSAIEETSDVLQEFSESEFDRFNEFDILSRDIKSSMLNFEDSIKELRDFSSFLNQNIVKVSTIANDLNRVIVDMRMVPVKQMFIRFSRSVRDIAKSQNKNINFITEGEETKLDKMVMEEVVEPMMHIVRNSIGHGIESPEEREQAGKPNVGQVTLRAYQKGNRVILEVEDDGAGISIDKVKRKAIEKHLITKDEAANMSQEEATAIIFKPGFSTAEQVTSLHGRGVGLDVVHNTIRKLKGFVNIDSKEGHGTKFIISLPLTLAISDALLVEAEGYKYAIPLDMVYETVNYPSEYIEHEEDKRFIEIRGEKYELVYLNDLLGYESDVLHFKATLPVAVIELENSKVAVGVEKLFGKEEIVVKALGSHLKNVRGVIGATIRGDGQVILILDMNFLLSPEEQKGKDLYINVEKSDIEIAETTQPKLPERTKHQRKGEKICVLAADDSPSVRKYIQSVLQQHDIDVISVDDGLNALNKLPTSNCDIIITDLEMPRMNGFDLVSEVRKMPQYNELPIVIVTARAGDKHRRKGIELGANAFINKPFDPAQLIETIESFIS